VAAGVWLSCGAAGWALGSLTYARSVRVTVSDSGRVRSARLGSGLLCAGLVGQELVLVPGAPAAVPFALWILASFGLGLALVPMGTSLYEESPVEDYPMNAAALQLADVSIAALIIGLGGTVSSTVGREHQADVVVVSFLVAAILAAGSAVAAPRICSTGRSG
jgi:hypothetical protein